MPEADRLKAINRVIEALKKKEKEERDALLAEEAEQRQIEQADFEQADFMQRQPQPLPPTPQGMQQGNGQWYFYNPVAVSQGKNTFQQQWGKRENTDNWQRMNRTVVNLNPGEGNKGDTEDTEDAENSDIEASSDSIAAPTDTLANDPHNRG
jgi:hypothetical protein